MDVDEPNLDDSTAETNSSARGEQGEAPVRPGVVKIFPTHTRGAPVWAVRGSLIAGRSGDAAIQLNDGSASRKHATLERAHDGLLVKDLGSSHGTFIDGKPIAGMRTLAPFGSVIRIGGTLLLVAEDVSGHSTPARNITGAMLGTPRDVIAGPELRAVWQQAAAVASLSHPVLILGESGSGKEAVARLIHVSREKPGPFVALNLAAIPDSLFESELFGHVRGAFTGAVAARAGAFSQASGGVLFMDEVADLRSEHQVKLLRVLDEMRVRAVGADDDVPVNVRLVAATSRDLREACAAGKFRADLYYRLSGIVLRVPALRARRADILLLASAFLQQENAQQALSVRAAETLALARWRGNVRELHYALAHASVQAATSGTNEILVEHLPELDAFEPDSDEPLTADRVRAALIASEGNVSRAARALIISRSTLYKLIRQYDLKPVQSRGEQ